VSTTALATATILLERGDYTEAARRVATVLAGEPDNVDALVLMAQAQLGLSRPATALPPASRAAALAPGDGHPLGVLSRVFTDLHRHPEAVDAAYEAVRREPHHPHRHNRAAWALLGAGRPAEAEAPAHRAVTLAPQHADFHITYAVVMKRLKREERARAALLEALRLEPDNSVARHELATLDVLHRNMFALGRLARGAEGLAGALRSNPAQQQSRLMLDLALRRFLIRVAILLGVLAYVGWRVAETGAVSAARVLAGVAALAPVAFAGWFVSRLSATLRAYLRTVVTSGGQRNAAVGAVISVAMLLTATAAPATWLVWLLGGAALASIGVRVLTVSETNARVRAAGVHVPRGPATVTLVLIGVAGALGAVLTVLGAVESGRVALYGLAGVLAVAAAGCCVVLVRRRRPDR
jgi:Flp pilus assembly protein TadD